ncbi:MarR family winged helix-turn-helix transcriptional regulator [Galbitalea sp. SE-J8]|uniref:MarR family winged helix-turn-helix transcriptional regulator n=1 Tax=Galbitalea sp. SE-J8 TaxID=3054952 RepID=UPI00259C8290|nr:MarR family winged helix-turn-helix transcriptional regulator [Galbitalea sp. SE-J8]MDM4762199.1 MarR family winged helix-turn-helix transcriptional regulator [Galbitalea sp. SE-J8]
MTDPAGANAANRLAHVVARLSRRIRGANTGLSYGPLSALATIEKFAPVRLADVAHQEFISAPSTTRLVADLERRGLVSRSVDPDDGRAFLLDVTAAGETEVSRARTARGALVERLFVPLDESDLALIVAALPALERLLELDERAQRR